MNDDTREPGAEHGGLRRDLDRIVMRSVGWLTVSLGGSQVVSFVSILLLARLLVPSDFGLVAVAAPVINVLQEFQDSGSMSALIYRRHDIERAAASILVFAPLNALFLYGIGFFVAPYLADLVGDSSATNVIRALLAIVLVRSAGMVPSAILERNMDYRARTKVDIATALSQGGLAVGLALVGAGVWSLVAGQLVGAAAGVVVAWLLVPWRPDPRQASFRVLREVLRYGRWVGLFRAVNIVNRSLDNFVVARALGAGALGIYAIAFRLADLPVSLVGMILGRVLFPLYSHLADDLESVRRAFVQNLQRVALVLLPVIVGLLVCARPIVLGLLGPKWSDAVTPLRILAVWALVRAFVSPSGPVFDGRGKPQLGLWFALPSTGILFGLLVWLVPKWGIAGAAASQAVAISAAGIPALLVAMRMIGLRVSVLARALAPSALCSAILGVALALATVSTRSLPPGLSLIVLVAVGLVVYLPCTAIFARSVVMPMWWSMRGPSDQPLS